MGKKLAIRGHSTHGKEVIELLEMMGGKNIYNLLGNDEKFIYYVIECNEIKGIPFIYDLEDYPGYIFFTLEEFLSKYPFKVGDKVFLYDNITEGCVTGMEWDENKGTVKYCVYTSAEYWCDVKELLKWNPIDFLDDKHCNEKQVNGMKNVLTELLSHIKNTPKEELEREFEEIKEWSNVGPTVEEFMTFCECVNKKPVYPTTYEECCKNVLGLVHWGMTVDVPMHYSPLIINFTKLLICRDAYWEIAGDEMGLDKPWKPDWNDGELKWCMSYSGKYIEFDQYKFKHHILVFPTAEMRDAFYENFKDLIEQCKEFL